MKLIVALLALLAANSAYADKVRFGQFPKQEQVNVEGFVQYAHQTDLFTGPLLPFTLWGDTPYEPSYDLISGGGTISYKRWEFDLSHGVETIDCDLSRHCDLESGTQLAMKYYFRRSDDALVLDAMHTIAIEPFLGYIHLSDLVRGRPFNDENAPQNDYIGIGVTVQYRRFEFDISHGVKSYTCSGLHACEWESGTVVAFRLYPGRKL